MSWPTTRRLWQRHSARLGQSSKRGSFVRFSGIQRGVDAFGHPLGREFGLQQSFHGHPQFRLTAVAIRFSEWRLKECPDRGREGEERNCPEREADPPDQGQAFSDSAQSQYISRTRRVTGPT